MTFASLVVPWLGLYPLLRGWSPALGWLRILSRFDRHAHDEIGYAIGFLLMRFIDGADAQRGLEPKASLPVARRCVQPPEKRKAGVWFWTLLLRKRLRRGAGAGLACLNGWRCLLLQGSSPFCRKGTCLVVLPSFSKNVGAPASAMSSRKEA